MKRPTPEDALLFALCRQHLGEAERESIRRLCAASSIGWESLAATAESHGVAPLIARNLFACAPEDATVPPAVRERLSARLIHNMALEEAVAERMDQVLGFFNARGPAIMPIKGVAMKLLVYDHPWYTTSWDVDLIVGAREQDLSQALRAEIGALFAGSTGGPCYIEYNYMTHHDLVTPGGLPLDFDAIWDRSREIRVGDRRARVMSPEDLLLSACINSCRKRYFRLKALFDIAEIVRLYPDLDWFALAESARVGGCEAIVYAALTCAVSTLECPVPATALEALCAGTARKALIRALAGRMSFTTLKSLDGGRRVFGRKVGAGLMLPYASYTTGHVLRGLRHVIQDPHVA